MTLLTSLTLICWPLMVAPSISCMSRRDFRDKICFGIRMTKVWSKHQSPALGSWSPETSPCRVELSKSLPASLCSDQPNHLERQKDAPLQCRLFQPRVQGTSSELFLTQSREQKGSAAGIQGTNDSNALTGSSCVNATSESKRSSHLGGLGCLVLPAEGDKGISGEEDRS